MALQAVRREVTRRKRTPRSPVASTIPSVGRMEVLAPEQPRPRSGLREHVFISEPASPDTCQQTLREDSAEEENDSPSGLSPSFLTSLNQSSHNADSVRAELESYMDHVREIADLGDDFEEKVSFNLKSDQAAQALEVKREMDHKVALGMKKIAKLEEKLAALEKREVEVSLCSSTSSKTFLNHHSELTNYSHQSNDINESLKLVLPPLPGKQIAGSSAQQKGKRRRRRSRRSALIEADELEKGSIDDDTESVGSVQSSSFIERNIKLAQSVSRVMTAQDEARVEQLLLLQDFDGDEDDDCDSQVDGTETSRITHTARSNAPETEDDIRIATSLRELVGPDEWITKSVFLSSRPDEDDCDDDEMLVEIHSAGSIDGRSLSQLSRVTIPRSVDEAKRRLVEIDDALKQSSQLLLAPEDVQCSLHVLLADAQKVVSEHGVASRQTIEDLLCTMGIRSPHPGQKSPEHIQLEDDLQLEDAQS